MKLRILAVISVCCAAAALFFDSQSESRQSIPVSAGTGSGVVLRTPVEMRRNEEQTFLTFPEWYLVYSPDEYADFLRDQPPSEFPLLDHIVQFWQGYSAVYQETKDRYPFNGEYHLMIMVIGTSTTVEYGLKWTYEAVVGRLAESIRRQGLTAEDRLAAKVAREYADFLNIEPWYKFDYLDALDRLWTKTDLWGPDPIRKWERRYILTTEYVLKAIYAKILRQGSESAYGIIETVTTCVLDRSPDDELCEQLDMKILERFSDGAVLIDLPRYQKFSDCTSALAEQNINFIEIAGNVSTILVSAVVPEDFEIDASILFTQPILTHPGSKRIVFRVPIDRLTATVKTLAAPNAHLEHVYDF